MSKQVGCGILGYGPVFSFGMAHGRWISGVPELRLAAICDRDPECAARAAGDFPSADVHRDLDEMLARRDVELVSVVTPHNTHADLVIRCLRAGKHVIVDKPMCITVAEADAMMREAERAGRTLAVFHNRRRDGNYRLVHKLVREGAVGRVFHIELRAGWYGAGSGWRADKAVCGGVLYDMGAHMADWLLTLVPSRVTAVSGYFHKLRWDGMSISDQGRAVVRFEDGTVGDMSVSYLDAAGGPLWKIQGTEGAIVDSGRDCVFGYRPPYSATCQSPGKLLLIRYADGKRTEEELPYMASTWGEYYAETARHLLDGGPVPVPASDGRRAIALIEAAGRSAELKRELAMTF